VSKTGEAVIHKLDAEADRLPQRFRYRMTGETRWLHGVAVPIATEPPTWRIELLNSPGCGAFDDSPWEILGHILGADVDSFQWIDNDYRWESHSEDCDDESCFGCADLED